MHYQLFCCVYFIQIMLVWLRWLESQTNYHAILTMTAIVWRLVCLEMAVMLDNSPTIQSISNTVSATEWNKLLIVRRKHIFPNICNVFLRISYFIWEIESKEVERHILLIFKPRLLHNRSKIEVLNLWALDSLMTRALSDAKTVTIGWREQARRWTT